jgi:biotin carboxyl carrier protein
MQFEIQAPRSGRLEAVLVQVGQILQGPEPLALLE